MDDFVNSLNEMNDNVDLKDTMDEYSIEFEQDENNILKDTLTASSYFSYDNLFDYLKNNIIRHQSLSLLYLNIQSLPAKFEKLKNLMASLYDHGIILDAVLLCGGTWWYMVVMNICMHYQDIT